MLDLNNKADRKLVYLAVLEKYENYLGTPSFIRPVGIAGFCYELKWNRIEKLMGRWFSILDLFPEVLMFESYRNDPNNQFWFSLDNEGCWKRVSILSHAIRMCDHPWTIPFYKFLIRFKLIRLGL